MRLWFAVVLASLSACGTSYTLSEEEGVQVARDAFRAHNVYTTSTRPLGPLRVDDQFEVPSFTVDGWSLADLLGFEYVSEGDPDFATAPVDLGADGQSLQAAVDLATEGETGNVKILVLRTWGHETYELAAEQMTGAIDAWITAQGR